MTQTEEKIKSLFKTGNFTTPTDIHLNNLSRQDFETFLNKHDLVLAGGRGMVLLRRNGQDDFMSSEEIQKL